MAQPSSEGHRIPQLSSPQLSVSISPVPYPCASACTSASHPVPQPLGPCLSLCLCHVSAYASASALVTPPLASAYASAVIQPMVCVLHACCSLSVCCASAIVSVIGVIIWQLIRWAGIRLVSGHVAPSPDAWCQSDVRL